MNKPIKKVAIEDAILEQIQHYIHSKIENYYGDDIHFLQQPEGLIDGWFLYSGLLNLEGYTIFEDTRTITKIEFTIPYYSDDGLEKRRLAIVFRVSDFSTSCYLERIDFVQCIHCVEYNISGRRVYNLIYTLEDLVADKRKLFKVWNTINKTEKIRQYKIENLLKIQS